MNESEETGTTEQLDATMPPVPHVPGVTDQYQYTPDDYRKFRTLLRIFRDAIAFNYAHFKEHDVRFGGGA